MTSRVATQSSDCFATGELHPYFQSETVDLEPAIRAVALDFLERARKDYRGSDPDLSVQDALLMSQRARLRLKAAEKHDGTPELLLVEGEGPLWIEVLKALEDHVRWTTLLPGARVVIAADPNVVSLEAVLSETSEEFGRLRTAVSRNGTESEKSKILLKHFFSDYRTPRSRPVALTLVENTRAALAQPPPEAPRSLKAFDARFQRLEERLGAAYDGRNKPKAIRVWFDEAQIAVLALQIALGDLLTWASSTALLKRLRQFERVIAPRHRKDGTAVLVTDPSAPLEEDEIQEELTDEDRELDAQLEPVEIGGLEEEQAE